MVPLPHAANAASTRMENNERKMVRIGFCLRGKGRRGIRRLWRRRYRAKNEPRKGGRPTDRPAEL